mmetsp:Transcript_8811/g.16809  ORF Transcript_8811/g.16809 Transcript_8811/m.16809 type:complete len:514 (+) Transcript_8811:79-1620(+)
MEGSSAPPTVAAKRELWHPVDVHRSPRFVEQPLVKALPVLRPACLEGLAASVARCTLLGSQRGDNSRRVGRCKPDWQWPFASSAAAAAASAAGGVTLLRVAIDQRGRRWETPVSFFGPKKPRECKPDDVTARWHAGAGQLRVVCHNVDRITALGMCQETLVFGTSAGLVRAVDVESGSVVGDYYLGSHLPGAPISTLRFDGTSIVAGDVKGRLHVWRAKLPGSWGFSAEPDWVLSSLEEANAEPVHCGALTGLDCISEGRLLASSDSEGKVVFWELSAQRQTQPLHQCSLPSPVCALCAGDGHNRSVLVGTESGHLLRLKAEEGQSDLQQEELQSFEGSITALVWDAARESLILGLKDGGLWRWQPNTSQAPQQFFRLHGGAVQHLSITVPPDDGALSSVLRLVSTCADGRIGVWDLDSDQPLWGLQGLSADHLVAVGDYTRLLCNGLVVNERREKGSCQNPRHNWKESRPTVNDAPSCAAVLCFDVLAEQADAAETESRWPGEVEAQLRASG